MPTPAPEQQFSRCGSPSFQPPRHHLGTCENCESSVLHPGTPGLGRSSLGFKSSPGDSRANASLRTTVLGPVPNLFAPESCPWLAACTGLFPFVPHTFRYTLCLTNCFVARVLLPACFMPLFLSHKRVENPLKRVYVFDLSPLLHCFILSI